MLVIAALYDHARHSQHGEITWSAYEVVYRDGRARAHPRSRGTARRRAAREGASHARASGAPPAPGAGRPGDADKVSPSAGLYKGTPPRLTPAEVTAIIGMIGPDDHAITPVAGSARRARDGQPADLRNPAHYPVVAVCLACGGAIFCERMMFCEWRHDTAEDGEP
jgi:hypothetical protein